MRALRLYFSMNVMLLVMLGVVFPFLEPDTGAYVISLVSFAIIVPSILCSGIAIRYGWTPPWQGNA